MRSIQGILRNLMSVATRRCRRTLIALKLPSRMKASFIAVVITLAVHGGARLIDGRPVHPGEYAAVFSLTTKRPLLENLPKPKDGKKRVGICTATLIHERILITAAHCVDGVKNIPLHVQNGEHASDLDHVKYADVENYGAYTDWVQSDRKEKDPFLAEANDIGFVLVRTPILGVDPVSMYFVDQPKQLERLVHWAMTFVGYGARTVLPSALDRPNEVDTKAVATTSITGVDRGRIYYRGLHGNITSGDSGGPAFIRSNGAETLIGIIASGMLEKTTDAERLGFVAPLRRAHLCFIQEKTGISLGMTGCPRPTEKAD